MVLDELLDDDAFRHERLFNDKEFNTIVIDRDGFSKKENEAADLVANLTDPGLSRAEKDDIYSRLKELNAQKVLVEGIKSTELLGDQAVLTAACWESGLDFSAYYLFFTALAVSGDFQLSMEAFTVLENCETGPGDTVLKDALQLLEKSPQVHNTIRLDLEELIRSRMTSI
jgi:hypothetical protein